MKILFTGGGSGGHFYPIIAIVEEIEKIVSEKKLVPPMMFFVSDTPYKPKMLAQHSILFEQVQTGKIRRYFSVLNFLDFFKTIWGVIFGLIKIFKIYPDIIFGKGGYASFPALLAGKLFHIPVFIHESDSVPGKVNLWASNFAERIAISYPEAFTFFQKHKERVAWTGNPVRSTIKKTAPDIVRKFLRLEDNVPIVLVLGGSQGAEIINNLILESLEQTLPHVQIIHQTGDKNFEAVRQRAAVILNNNPLQTRYKIFDYLEDETIAMAAGGADVVVSRAGSTIFEIASWGLPSIIIPITDSNGNHQRLNAFNYAKTGAAIVIEEANLSPIIFANELMRIISNPELKQKMKERALSFYKADAGRKIAEEIINICLKH
jgi:UDP-N-acetylglucosamine--N-acetylmuramyl-(pentapeptide) pyrophosphoryl-undecaprenol N-acetylglucosamine transferase